MSQNKGMVTLTQPKPLTTLWVGKYRKSLPWFLPSLCFSVWGRRRKLGLSGGKKTAHNAKTIWQPADCERMEEERGENTNRFQVFAHSILENAGWFSTHCSKRYLNGRQSIQLFVVFDTSPGDTDRCCHLEPLLLQTCPL